MNCPLGLIVPGPKCPWSHLHAERVLIVVPVVVEAVVTHGDCRHGLGRGHEINVADEITKANYFCRQARPTSANWSERDGKLEVENTKSRILPTASKVNRYAHGK